MMTNDYFNELSACLKDLDKNSRQEILKELKAVAQDENYENLVKRFGTPKDMASNYLEDIPLKSKKLNILLYILFAVLFVFIIAYFVIKSYIKDPFDFSKYDEVSIEKQVKQTWNTASNIDNLNINQSKVVIYFSKNDELKYSCDEETIKKEDGTFFISQSFCYVIAPYKNLNLKTYQSNVVLIKPLKDLDIDIQQSSYELVSKDKNYEFILDKDSSNFEGFDSIKDETKIRLKMYQSNFEKYEY